MAAATLFRHTAVPKESVETSKYSGKSSCALIGALLAIEPIKKNTQIKNICKPGRAAVKKFLVCCHPCHPIRID